MNQIFVDALAHPLFVSMCSIVVTGILLAEFSRRRDKRNEILRQRVAFIDETVNLLNVSINRLYSDIDQGHKEPSQATFDSLTAAFENRLRFELYSEALFQGRLDPEKDFVDILHCLTAVANEIRAADVSYRTDHISQRKELVERWAIENIDLAWARDFTGARKEQAISVGVCFRSSRKLLSMMLECSV